MSRASHHLDRFEKLLTGICIAIFATMFLLGVITVLFRFVIQSSLAFPDEMLRYLFVWLIALGSAVAMRRNAHASIGMFVNWFEPRARKAVLFVTGMCTTAFLIVVIYYGIALCQRGFNQISPALEVSMFWAYAAIPVGALAMLIFVLEAECKRLFSPDSPQSRHVQ